MLKSKTVVYISISIHDLFKANINICTLFQFKSDQNIKPSVKNCLTLLWCWDLVTVPKRYAQVKLSQWVPSSLVSSCIAGHLSLFTVFEKTATLKFWQAWTLNWLARSWHRHIIHESKKKKKKRGGVGGGGGMEGGYREREASSNIPLLQQIIAMC